MADAEAVGSDVDPSSANDDPQQTLRDFIIDLMRTHTAYELIPESAKVVVFDAKLHIRHAIRALLDHDIKCAPVWSPSEMSFVGMITITDFIQILLETFNDANQSINERLEAMTVGEWSNWSRRKNPHRKVKIIGCYPDENIYKAARLLHTHFIHRLPIQQKGFDTSILCILNHQSIMRFLFQQIPPSRAHLLLISIEELGIGWFEDVVCSPHSSPLIDVVRLCQDKTIPAVPILDEDGNLLDAFSRSDIRFLVADSNIKETCEKTIQEFLDKHHQGHWIPRCQRNASLQTVVTRMLDTRKHSCLIVDKGGKKLLGMVTLRHIFGFFFQNCLDNDNPVMSVQSEPTPANLPDTDPITVRQDSATNNV